MEETTALREAKKERGQERVQFLKRVAGPIGRRQDGKKKNRKRRKGEIG